MRTKSICPMASPPDSSSGKRTTNILVVEVKSYTVFANKKKPAGNIFMNLWINPQTKLRSRTIRCSKAGPNTILWNQKFVFSLSHDFFKDNSSFRIQILRARKYLPHSQLGFAECKLGCLFPESKGEDIEKQANYDTDDDDDSQYGSGSDTSLPKLVIKGGDGSESESESETETVRKFEERRDYFDEVKKSVTLQILKGFLPQGVLNVEMTLKRECISYIGKAELRSFAMAYDEFMMDVVQHKAPICMCFPQVQSIK